MMFFLQQNTKAFFFSFLCFKITKVDVNYILVCSYFMLFYTIFILYNIALLWYFYGALCYFF